jgi:hypothetical protein
VISRLERGLLCSGSEGRGADCLFAQGTRHADAPCPSRRAARRPLWRVTGASPTEPQAASTDRGLWPRRSRGCFLSFGGSAASRSLAPSSSLMRRRQKEGAAARPSRTTKLRRGLAAGRLRSVVAVRSLSLQGPRARAWILLLLRILSCMILLRRRRQRDVRHTL